MSKKPDTVCNTHSVKMFCYLTICLNSISKVIIYYNQMYSISLIVTITFQYNRIVSDLKT